MREVLNSLLHSDLDTADEAMTPYYQDVHDHQARGLALCDRSPQRASDPAGVHSSLRVESPTVGPGVDCQ